MITLLHRHSASAALIAVVLGGVSPALAATCLTHRTNALAGEKIVSPYGVDRTGRASKGWHQGIDIVNSVGKGDPILSGSAGAVNFRRSHGDAAGNYATVDAGDMRFIYMHMETIMDRLAGKTVNAGDQIGTMGCSGLAPGCPVHLHLGAMMRGDALQASGAAGRVWRVGSGKSASPLSADQIKAALPTAWYYVNPEPFLSHQIPLDGSGGAKAAYGPQMGGWRSVSLPRTCSPDQTSFENPRVASTTGTGAAANAIAGVAADRGGNEGAAAAIAGQDGRGVLVDLAKLEAAELHQGTSIAALRDQAYADVALAHLLLKELERE